MHKVRVKGILSAKNGMNLYRGCSHGCIYCDSRSRVYGMDHDFEDIEVKENALELLEGRLRSKRKKCMLGMGAMTDPYIPLEETMGLTRGALELALKYGFGMTLITKSSRVLRDIDLISSIYEKSKFVLQMTVTSFDEKLCRIIEPHVSTTRERFETIGLFRERGIPVVVWLCPILPYINDSLDNIAPILEKCIELGVEGVLCFGMGVTLREGNREYFYDKLDRYFPGLKERYIREFGSSYSLSSPHNQDLMDYFKKTCQGAKIMYRPGEIFTYLNTFPERKEGNQLSFL